MIQSDTQKRGKTLAFKRTYRLGFVFLLGLGGVPTCCLDLVACAFPSIYLTLSLFLALSVFQLVLFHLGRHNKIFFLTHSGKNTNYTQKTGSCKKHSSTTFLLAFRLVFFLFTHTHSFALSLSFSSNITPSKQNNGCTCGCCTCSCFHHSFRGGNRARKKPPHFLLSRGSSFKKEKRNSWGT